MCTDPDFVHSMVSSVKSLAYTCLNALVHKMGLVVAVPRLPPLSPCLHRPTPWGLEHSSEDHTLRKHELYALLTPTHTEDIPLIRTEKCEFPPTAILGTAIPCFTCKHHEH